MPTVGYRINTDESGITMKPRHKVAEIFDKRDEMKDALDEWTPRKAVCRNVKG
ncbi:MAG: hypothetical protein ACLUFP_04665 [Streptococcus salivarius]